MQSTRQSEVFTTSEAAAFLRICEKTLRSLLASSNPPPRFRVGRQWRFLRSDLEAWARSQGE